MGIDGGSKYFIIALIASLLLLALFTLFRRTTRYRVAGEIDIANAYRNDLTEINYGAEFATPPKICFFKEGLVDYTPVDQRNTGFSVKVTGFGSGSSLKWEAIGVPKPMADPRSVWGKFDWPQKVLSITSILSAIGLLADLLGIFQFFGQGSSK